MVYMGILKALAGLIISAILVTATAEAAQGCKTPKGQRCICAASSVKKCAHIAKAVCLSGKIVETPVGQLLTVHENNKELFRLCRENGGMKEVVSNVPMIDSFHNASAPAQQDTASAGD